MEGSGREAVVRLSTEKGLEQVHVDSNCMGLHFAGLFTDALVTNITYYTLYYIQYILYESVLIKGLAHWTGC